MTNNLDYLYDLSFPELRTFAKDIGIEIKGKHSKTQFIELIKKAISRKRPTNSRYYRELTSLQLNRN